MPPHGTRRGETPSSWTLAGTMRCAGALMAPSVLRCAGIGGFDEPGWSGGEPRAPPAVGGGGGDGSDVEVLPAVVGGGEHVHRLAAQGGARGRAQPAADRGSLTMADPAARLEDRPRLDHDTDNPAALDAHLLAVAMDRHLARDAPSHGARVAAGDLDLLSVGLLAHPLQTAAHPHLDPPRGDVHPLGHPVTAQFVDNLGERDHGHRRFADLHRKRLGRRRAVDAVRVHRVVLREALDRVLANAGDWDLRRARGIPLRRRAIERARDPRHPGRSRRSGRGHVLRSAVDGASVGPVSATVGCWLSTYTVLRWRHAVPRHHPQRSRAASPPGQIRSC